jgi:hypothetical protein
VSLIKAPRRMHVALASLLAAFVILTLIFVVSRPYEYLTISTVAGADSIPSSNWESFGVGARHHCTDGQGYTIGTDLLGSTDSKLAVLFASATDAQGAECATEQVRVFRRHRWWWEPSLGPACLNCSEPLR